MPHTTSSPANSSVPSTAPDLRVMSGWFAGPKAENGDWFTQMLRSITQDYHAWRRNYFPEDGVVLDASARRESEAFRDAFDDRLLELLGRLKADYPFYSPRYAAHMVAEQTLPSIAGYLAAMLYNPNNVSSDSAPVTVRLEIEACKLISRMLGHDEQSWAHLTSGGTVANIEAMWVARTVKYLPLIVADMRRTLGLAHDARTQLGLLASPSQALACLEQVFKEARSAKEAVAAYLASPHNVVEQGISKVCARVGSDPVLFIPETHHYCFEKALDVLGIGRRGIVSIRVDRNFRAIIEDVEAKLDAVHAQGRHVLAVVGIVGTTEEGAVDPIDRLVALRNRREQAGKESFWLHADGAYGGYLRTMTLPSRLGLGAPSTKVQVLGREHTLALALPSGSSCDALDAMGECDSITIDPHKLGYIPYPAGAVCFKSNLVKPITRQEAPYIEDGAGDLETERKSDSIGLYILEGSKPGAAAAAVWLSHTLIPLDSSGHGLLVRETVRRACELHALLSRYEELSQRSFPVRCVPLCEPGSNIVCYAFVPHEQSQLRNINALNRAVFDAFSIHSGQRVYDQRFFVSRTTIRS